MKNVLKMSVNVCVFDIKATCLENEIPILNNVVMMSLLFITMLNSCSVLVMWKWIILSCVSVLLAFVATRAVSFSHLIFQN